jgi:hypothetical protein
MSGDVPCAQPLQDTSPEASSLTKLVVGVHGIIIPAEPVEKGLLRRGLGYMHRIWRPYRRVIGGSGWAARTVVTFLTDVECCRGKSRIGGDRFSVARSGSRLRFAPLLPIRGYPPFAAQTRRRSFTACHTYHINFTWSYGTQKYLNSSLNRHTRLSSCPTSALNN